MLLQLDTLATGEMDYDHFRAKLAANSARPAIVNVNCGTTVKGAVDDLDRVLDILRETGYSEDRIYIHVDGALFGMMVRILLGIYTSDSGLQRSNSLLSCDCHCHWAFWIGLATIELPAEACESHCQQR